MLQGGFGKEVTCSPVLSSEPASRMADSARVSPQGTRQPEVASREPSCRISVGWLSQVNPERVYPWF